MDLGVVHVCHTSDRDIAGFRDKPVLSQWQLIKMPTAPLFKLTLTILDYTTGNPQTQSFSYDSLNRMVSASGAATATYLYDGDGNRVKSITGGITTVYVGSYYEWTSTSTPALPLFSYYSAVVRFIITS